MTRLVTVWWAQWPIVAAGAVDRPAIVLRANRVVACSAAASAAGVRIGQRKRTAQRRCPAAELFDHDPDRDAERFESAVRAVGEFVPLIEVVEPGWLCFDLRGPARYFGGDAAFLATLRDRVGAAPGIGVADGWFASAVAARRAGAGAEQLVSAGESAAFLAVLPVAWLAELGEISPDLGGMFARLGLATLGDLAELPRVDVDARFGHEGVHAWDLATALDRHHLDAVEPPVERAVERAFDDPPMAIEPLVFVAKQLADELVERLAAEGWTCVRIVIVAETEHGERSERVWYRRTGFSSATIVERVRWQLDGWVTEPGGPSAGVSVVRLDPVELRVTDGEQLRLWGGPSAADERAARAATRLAGMIGEPAVRVPAWQGGRLPGLRYRWVPASTTDLTDPDGVVRRLQPPPHRTQGDRAHDWPGQLPAPSPTWLVGDERRPVTLATADGTDVTVSGRGELNAAPATLQIGTAAPHAVVAWAGPWPVDERWWDARRHRRLARCQVVTDRGVAYLVAIEQQRWWLLATYA